MRGLFVSDLHLFSRRSIGQERWASFQSTIQKSDCLVLGGDIIDFRWSHHRDLKKTLEAAGNWLDELAQENSNKQIVYILGNHDCHRPMQELLATIAERHSNFRWEEYYFRSDNKVFLHGDVLDSGITPHQLQGYRKRFASESRSRGPIPNLLYDAVVGMHIHKLPGHWIHQPAKTISRLSDYLIHEALTIENGVSQVYFGHTHRPMECQFGEQQFSNPGSGIRHLAFRPCVFA